MTSKEALEIIKEIPLDEYEEYKNVGYFYEREIEILEKLVDKDIPKKVFKTDYNYCPNCNNHYLIKHTKRCDECGQRLDWSD